MRYGTAVDENGADEGNAGPVSQVQETGCVEDGEVGSGADAQVADVGAAQGPRAARGRRPQRFGGVIRISRTASAMQNGIEDVYDEPGLQSVASATVAPASSRARASG